MPHTAYASIDDSADHSKVAGHFVALTGHKMSVAHSGAPGIDSVSGSLLAEIDFFHFGTVIAGWSFLDFIVLIMEQAGMCAEPERTASQGLGPGTNPTDIEALREIDSASLFQGASEVLIRHINGEVYRLRTTRNGRLILHK